MTTQKHEVVRGYLLVPVWMGALVVLGLGASRLFGLPWFVTVGGVSMVALLLVPLVLGLMGLRRKL